MYIPAENLKEEHDVEIVCLYTGESYVYLEGNDSSLIDPAYTKNALDYLPARFYKTPFIKRSPNGQVRVFGRID